MAVQKNRKTRSKRGMRRSHDALKDNNARKMNAETGDMHLRHHLTADGVDRKGRQITAIKEELVEAASEAA